MSVRLALSGAVLLGAALSGTAYAQQICDPYSEQCPDENSCSTDAELQARNEVTRTTSVDAQGNEVVTIRRIKGCDETVEILSVPRTLPFTGGELVTYTAVGAGTLVGGIALVVAGRRRRPALDA